MHIKTSYDMVNVTKKRFEYVNVTSAVLDNSTDANSTMAPTYVTNLTKTIVEYKEEVEVRSLKYGNGINVLGEYCHMHALCVLILKVNEK